MARRKSASKSAAAKADTASPDTATDAAEVQTDCEPAPTSNGDSATPPAKKETPRATKRKAAATKNSSPPKRAKASENGVSALNNSRPKRSTVVATAPKTVKASIKKSPKKVGKKPAKAKPAPKDFEVESIIDSRVKKGKTEYKIRWKGYSAKSDTWEPEGNLNCQEILDAFKEEKAKVSAD